MINIFYHEVVKTLEKIEYEIIFVDDGSKDRTLEEIKNIKDKNVRYISFSRNFGKEAAMYAGLTKAVGDYVSVMDVDLQDPPELLIEMLDILTNEDIDVVGTRRVTRKGEPKIRSFFARKFYKIINKMSNVEMVDGARDFRLMKRYVVDSILEMKEYNRYSKGIFSFVGFKTTWLEYENKERVAGTTKWNFIKLFKYAIEGILAFSNTLLTIPIYLGITSLLAAFVFLFLTIFNYNSINLLITIILFLFGLLFIALGIMSLYISKIILEVRKRPIYIVREED